MRNRIIFNTVEANPSALIPLPPDLEAVVAAAKLGGRFPAVAAVLVGEVVKAGAVVAAALDPSIV